MHIRMQINSVNITLQLMRRSNTGNSSAVVREQILVQILVLVNTVAPIIHSCNGGVSRALVSH